MISTDFIFCLQPPRNLCDALCYDHVANYQARLSEVTNQGAEVM